MAQQTMPADMPPLPAELASIAALPADSPRAAEPVIKALLAGGPAMVARLVTAVGQTFGDPAGVKPTYAIHGLVHYACRPDAPPAERRMIADALAAELARPHSADLKSFICQQLQLCGDTGHIPAMAALLGDDALCEPATQAIAAIGGEPARAALRTALPAATGKRRTTLINALGALCDRQAADEMRKSLADADENLRLVTLYALGNIGDEASADALLKAAAGPPGFFRTQATDACLRLARAMAGRGDAAGAEKVLRRLMQMRAAPDEWHERLAALEALATACGAAAVPDVMAALESADLRYRTGAARIALDFAAALRAGNRAEAGAVLRKIAAATEEQAVRQRAAALLAM